MLILKPWSCQHCCCTVLYDKCDLVCTLEARPLVMVQKQAGV